jgi:hypothetical protein
MPVVTLGTAPTTVIEANKKRKLLTMTNTHASAIAYISDKAQPNADTAKWILYPYETLIFDGQGDFPERAYFGVSDTATTVLQVGFQNEET